MPTILKDGRGQVTLKGREITAEWETLLKAAAKRNGQSVADFVVTFTTEAAQAILKGQSAVPSAVPARLEDVADALTGAVTRLADELRREQEASAEKQAQALEALRQEQAATVAALQRASRRGRWR